jgi:23S rRNA (cytidine1920-2'-O)/16S rRNA (cytidine1409-2'-O)-methyltransferase
MEIRPSLSGKQAPWYDLFVMASKRKRLDVALVERGLAPSRAVAQRLILAGEVLVGGQIADKPASFVPEGARIELKAKPRYASQGGLKLEKALREFSIDVKGKDSLDIGASTGGFTDCLLQHGARRVYAVDVGKGQLDWKLRQDSRVIVLEGVNARYSKPEQIGGPIDLATVDVSFISVKKILPALKPIVKPGGDLIVLIKPQFEAGRPYVGRGGVVKDPAVHERVLQDVAAFAERELELSVIDATHSPLKGPAGNIEFFIHLVNAPGRSREIDWAQLVREAHEELRGC